MSKTSRSSSISSDSSSVGYESEVDNGSFESPELKSLRQQRVKLQKSLAQDTEGVDPQFQKRILQVGHTRFVREYSLVNTSPDKPLVNNLGIDPNAGFGSGQFTDHYFARLNTYAEADAEVTRASGTLTASKLKDQGINAEITKLTFLVNDLSRTTRTRTTNFTRQTETLPTIPESFATLSVQEIRERQKKIGLVINPAPEEKVFEDKNKEALEKYIKLREQLEAKKQEKLSAEHNVANKQSALDSATTKRDTVGTSLKLDDVDKRMAIAIHQDPDLQDRLERSWKNRVALAQVEAKIYNIEDRLQKEQEKRKAEAKDNASVAEEFVVTDSPSQAAADKLQADEKKRAETVSKNEDFVVVGSEAQRAEDKELDKKLAIKLEAQQKAVKEYVGKTGSTIKWKDLEKEVLEDNAGKRGVFGGRPKNIEQKREAYSKYLKTLEKENIILTATQENYVLQQVVKGITGTVKVESERQQSPSSTPTTARGASLRTR